MKQHKLTKTAIDNDGKLHFFDEEDNEVFPKINPWPKRFLIAWIIIFTLAVGYAIHQQRISVTQNRARISDIQAERLASCKQTYEGIREVFKPFFRSPKVRTPKERRDIKKFNKIINNKENGCIRQVNSGG